MHGSTQTSSYLLGNQSHTNRQQTGNNKISADPLHISDFPRQQGCIRMAAERCLDFQLASDISHGAGCPRQVSTAAKQTNIAAALLCQAVSN